MSSTRVTLIRHGLTDWNVENRWQGHANVGLNAAGLAQAARLAEHLRGAEVSAIYTSDLSRARQTAQAIAQTVGAPLFIDARLREIDMGEWQGMTGDEAERWDAERLHLVRTGGLSVSRPSGESLEMVAVRARTLFDEVVAARHGEHVMLVSHGGTIRMLLDALHVLDDSHKHIGNTSRTVLHRPTADANWEIELYNALDHLDALGDSESDA